MSLSVREIWLQNFQVVKLGNLYYSLSGLKLETNLLIDHDKVLDNAAEER